FGEIEVAVPGDEVKRRRLGHVDAHADHPVQYRLLIETNDALVTSRAGLDANYPVIDLDLPLSRCDREHVVACLVSSEQLAEVECCHEVAVEHEERAVETLDETERSSRSERHILAHVRDVDAVTGTVAEDGLDEMGEMADGDRDID